MKLNVSINDISGTIGFDGSVYELMVASCLFLDMARKQAKDMGAEELFKQLIVEAVNGNTGDINIWKS